MNRQKNLHEFWGQKKFKSSSNFQNAGDALLSLQVQTQPLLTRHEICNSSCLDFVKRNIQLPVLNFTIPQSNPLHLEECFKIIKNICQHREEGKRNIILKQQQRKRKITKFQRKQKSQPLIQLQRQEIVSLQQEGYKNVVIAAMLNITPGQVRMNKSIKKFKTCKIEVEITLEIKEWILSQVKQDFNSCVFSSKLFHSQYQKTFPQNQISKYQFCQLLKSLQIKYRIPTIKPTSYFYRAGKDLLVLQFIENICGYISQNYNLIFVDECSLGHISKYCHKQWMIIGAAKQSIHRMSSFKCVLAAIGQQNFVYYQMIIGTGKAFIFEEFLSGLYSKAQLHYQSSKFVFVLDNCTIHKSKQMQILLSHIPHVFTPPYRPEFNGIEHLFGWLKRQIVIAQPVLEGQFIQIVHQILNQVDQQLIENWCWSIAKPILKELIYLFNLQK